PVSPYTVTYNGLERTASVSAITGVNGETAATVGTVDVSNTTHTNASTYSSDTWSFTGTANYNNQGPTTISDKINKADATFTVSPYDVTYNGLAHTATYTTITDANGATAATDRTVDVTNTSHTAARAFASASWSFTGAANYNDIASTTITDTVNKATSTTSFTSTSPGSLAYNGTYTPTATTTGDGTLAIGASGACSISGGTVTINAGSGVCTVTATTADGSNYFGSSATAQMITATKAAATVSFNAGTLSQTYDGSVKTAATTTSPTGLTVNLSFTGTPKDAASYPVTATINDANYQGTASDTLVINKAAGSVSINNIPATPSTGGNFTPTFTKLGDGTTS